MVSLIRRTIYCGKILATRPFQPTGADGNGDGVVNDSDYAICQNFGNVRGSAAAFSGSPVNASNVPEPGSIVLSIGSRAFVISRSPLPLCSGSRGWGFLPNCPQVLQ